MTHFLTLGRRGLSLMAAALTLGACDRVDPTEPAARPLEAIAVEATPVVPSFASAFKGGIPFGVFHLPKDQYGAPYTGSLANIYPNYLLDYLATAKRTGTKLILNFGGSEGNFVSNRKFSMEKWKKQVDRFKGVDFTPYIEDGTIIGHYIVDEPHDPENWGGNGLPKGTVDEMAKYSKQRWPALPTIVRAYGSWTKGYDWKYLDAAWAQYSARHGSVSEFIADNVRDAKASGLQLITGFNQLAGGGSQGLQGYYTGRVAVGPSEIESWGSVLLADSYPCAFISWQYDSQYMGRSDIKSALGKLAEKARNHPTKSCRSGATSTTPPRDDDDDDNGNEAPTGGNEEPAGGNEEPAGGNDGPSGGNEQPTGNGEGAPSAIRLAVSGSQKGSKQYMRLTWSGAKGSSVDVYRNDALKTRTENDGKYTNSRSFRGVAEYVYRVCERGTSTCSNETKVTFR